ncbi:PREDICTED: pheromone-binding protein-related protein 6 [Ceratosolen solmsi marchali]|uniref:Pheromone-binding protein-related protein 6 n=1 Tax=Ceratosolen solmsi marchali TaxID=326594 RepID=A0AAJ6YJM8_9HYME|nr:PREDICTED: pheromone-binding protein-related protein 6 [Ceratosolen solmsi marchali]
MDTFLCISINLQHGFEQTLVSYVNHLILYMSVDIEHVDRTVEGYFHPSEVLGCYFSCIFTTFDLVDNAGHIDFDKLSTRIPDSFKDHGTEMIEKCRHITGTNPCDSAFNIVQCFQKVNPSKYFVI